MLARESQLLVALQLYAVALKVNFGGAAEHPDLIANRVEIIQTRLEQGGFRAVQIDGDTALLADIDHLHQRAPLIQLKLRVRPVRRDHLDRAVIRQPEEDTRR